MALEIPKPKDWQAFQRNCVLLFRAELNDPHAQEYGRSGQKQHGIDVLARRNGSDEQFVGIQCRLISEPLKKAKILADAREALKLQAGLKELIFATTAPDDTGASDAAVAVTKLLRAEGHDITVVVYGWGQLQTLIAPHETAYNAFHPSAVSIAVKQPTGSESSDSDFAALVAAQVVERMRGVALTSGPRAEDDASSEEDPGLHARIDTFRDLFRDQGESLLAEKGLLGLLAKEDLTERPWARYRIETNLAAIAIDLGREEEAASRFEAAHSIRPEDSNALANLALARTIQGRFDEAMEVAHQALARSPRADHAVGYLLQAAARSNWEGEPESLIPDDLVGSPQADIGLAEFLRRRDLPDWAERSLALAKRHPEVPEFKRIRAIAVLSLSVETGEIIPGGRGAVSAVELAAAADDMKALVEHLLDVGFADKGDLFVHLNNAAVLLRLCERHAESEALLLRARHKVEDEPQLRRLLALAQSAQDRDAEAVKTLDGDIDPENQILRAELQASQGDVSGAMASAIGIPSDDLSERLQRFRWRIIGEMAIRLNDAANLQAAVAGLRAIAPDDVTATLFEIRGERKTLEDEGRARERLRAFASEMPASLDMMSRYLLAEALSAAELPEEASRLLDDHVDLGRASPATFLHLQTLAAARRDDAFRAALSAAAQEVRDDPTALWSEAAHAWNLGDLHASLEAVSKLLAQSPDDARARLLKIEILVRLDRSTELFAELEQPLEALSWRQPKDQFRLAALLGHFGFTERAAALAYRLFLQHRDLSRSWMTLSMLVLDESRGGETGTRPWIATEVAPDAAVDIDYDDGTETFFVVEPDISLRKLDPVSWEPDHALARVVTGLRAGDRFTGPDGREGVVRQVRHKYVARLHYVLKHYEARFPEVFGFKSLTVDVEREGGLDQLIAQVKARHDWIQEEEEQYLNGPMPLGVFAHRLGMDTIAAGLGVASHGRRLKVAVGSAAEREAAELAVRNNRKQGCVLDLLGFWTVWRLQAQEAVEATCGRIHLPRSVLDRLRARREEFHGAASEGLKSAGYAEGKLTILEVPAEAMRRERDEIDHAIAWAETNATVMPIVAGEALPAPLRELLKAGKFDVFDSLVLAHQNGLLLVSDDLPTREFGKLIGGTGGAWLHAVLGVALESKFLDPDAHVRWSANLVEAGHGYLGVSGPMLARAARLDAEDGPAPGYLFRTLSSMIGGSAAEPASHLRATIACLDELWSDARTADYREAVTGFLLLQLVRERHNDYAAILRTLLVRTRARPNLQSYIVDWLRGHFIAMDVLGSASSLDAA